MNDSGDGQRMNEVELHSSGKPQMGSAENAREENQRLRRTMRDLVALSTLPAVWTGLGLDGIARSLANVLLTTVSLDLIYIRLVGPSGQGVIEVARSRHAGDATQVEVVRDALQPLLEDDSPESPTSIDDPCGTGTLNVAVTRFGVSEDYGVLVTGSQRADFPTEQDRLLLGVGANQAAIIVQRRRSEARLRSQQEWIEQQRTARLAVTHALNQASTIAEGAEGVLQAVCENLGWEVGFFWAMNQDHGALTCLGSWHSRGTSVEDFEAASYSRKFQKGEGLPGRAWVSGDPTWVLDLSDDANFPRLAVARRYGLHSAFACPIIVGEQILGVIEFFTERIREPDAGLLEMIGTVAGNVGQFLERKAAEEELRSSERELADFFENATVGLHWVGPDGIIERANRAELEMLGYRRDEYVGHPIAEFHVDEESICEILRRLKAGEKLEEYPARMRCKDGSIKDVLIDSSVLWREGRFVHTRCFTRDITERKRAETALADARSRLDAALEAGAIATWTWDIPSDRLFADSNLARLFNLEPAEADGALLDQYIRSIHFDDLAPVREALKRSVESGTDYEADYRIVQADGSVRWVTARGRAIRDAAGRPVCMPGVLVDITERKRLEDELRETDRRKDEFLATLAHELRNPLAPIRNALQILGMPEINSATVQQTRDMMERQVQHLVRLVDDLLDVSRVTRGKIELRKEPVELAAVIARAVEIAQPLIHGQGHQLEIARPSEPLFIYADPVRLAQVVGNLLTNAAKYTEPGGRIELIAETAGGRAIMRVRDSGIGIDPLVLPHIFDLFVQVDHAATRSQGGLGIGLTLVKNLVEMHGGSVEAHSPGLGKGSEFTVRLPLVTGEIRQPRASSGQPAQRAPSIGHRVLVVDDNKDAAVSLAIILRAQGHDVRVVHDGPSALERLKTFCPAIIFLDIGMPGMDGHEVARRIRQLPGLHKVVLVALTGWGQKEDRRRTAEAGFDHHLVKPPELEVVSGLLADLQNAGLQNAD